MLILALAAAASSTFDPLRFFAGRTEGRGRLHVAMRRSRDVQVHGRGSVAGDTLVLDQTVERAGVAPATRQWRIRRIAPGRYVGTLSDATGPVTGESAGDTLHLSFCGAHGVRFDQWLRLAPDGRSAQNRLTVRKLGITLARLDETIRRVD